MDARKFTANEMDSVGAELWAFATGDNPFGETTDARALQRGETAMNNMLNTVSEARRWPPMDTTLMTSADWVH